jgi:thiamine-phosphate pyrophosphorylase
MKALFVTDRASCGTERLLAVLDRMRDARELTVQTREPGVTDRERLNWASVARERLGSGIPLYVNGRFDVALAAGSDGVHLPASGLPVRRVKQAVPRGFRVGVSTHSPEEVRDALGQGADLVLIGPIFDTPSKRAFGPPLGPETLAALPRLESHAAEVFAIGGIDEQNLSRLDPYRDRVTGVAGIRIFQDADDPRAVVERIAAR